jgi:hypothetical protein
MIIKESEKRCEECSWSSPTSDGNSAFLGLYELLHEYL